VLSCFLSILFLFNLQRKILFRISSGAVIKGKLPERTRAFSTFIRLDLQFVRLHTPSNAFPLCASVPASARRASDFRLEEFVFDHCLDSALAALIFSLSLLVFSSIFAKLKSVTRAILSRLCMGRNPNKLLKLQFSDEFDFERAIEAYEGLIDSTLANRRR
jgi:hypothetical protein